MRRRVGGVSEDGEHPGVKLGSNREVNLTQVGRVGLDRVSQRLATAPLAETAGRSERENH